MTEKRGLPRPAVSARAIAGLWACLWTAGWLVPPAVGQVRLPAVFGDHMVLQRGRAVPVWGWAAPGEEVTVALGDRSVAALADADGRWRAELPGLEPGGPHELVVSGSTTIRCADVWVGDVWLCSGQSNMEWKLGSCRVPDDVAAAQYPQIRCLDVPHRAELRPQGACGGHWQVCTPASAPGFSAVAFFFARAIHEKTGIPIGLLDATWGGTRIEPWTPHAGFAGVPELGALWAAHSQQLAVYQESLAGMLDEVDAWLQAARTAKAEARALPLPPDWPDHPVRPGGGGMGPSSLFNGMVHPLVPFAIKGAIWYQGEANGGEDDVYYHRMRALIGGWRAVWNQGDFPFYFVQLANWLQPTEDPAGGDGWAKVRMAQFRALAIPHTGMAVAIDIGEANNIHPLNKQDVGERLALWALARDYGCEDIVCSGPLYRAMSVEDGKIRISFDHVGSGLVARKEDGSMPEELEQVPLHRFAVAGEDRKWYWADAVIDGETVLVSSPVVAHPVAARYAFSMNPEGCNLYNWEGLPASPFRTDDW